LDIIEGYSQNESNATGNAWLGRKVVELQIRTFVDASLPVDFCIPAFPWKSVNRVDKVLGPLPDLGEQLALGRLQSLCEDIQDVYPPGAFVTVTSDGLVYNDAFGVPDEEVYIYGSALRRMATAKSFDRLKFMRMMNLLGLNDSPDMTKEEYLATVSMSRRLLQKKYGDPEFNAREAILNDPDINLTYRGLVSDLNLFFGTPTCS
jgi:pyoverdine/dityrosine biosynthesis protein Dit1